MDSDIIKAKSKLPMDFINEIYNNYSEKNADKILKGMCKERYTTLRVNTLKSSVDEVKKVFDENDFKYEICCLTQNDWKQNELVKSESEQNDCEQNKLKQNENTSKLNAKDENKTIFNNGSEQCSFYSDAFIIKNKNESDLQKLEIYKQGKIYIQSLSSMISPLLLDLKQDENILDMASAPGSKTTEMAAITNNTGKIIANEIDKIRLEKLNYNIKLQGATNIETINFDGANLYKKFPEKFDKVLLDTPCSGEGRFQINNPKSYSKWSNNLVNELTEIQKKLIESAFMCCKKGGTIVYSTCTLNKEENEKIIDYALKNFNVKLDEIKINVENKVNGNTKGIDKEISKTLKIIPNENFEGFYLAKLIKL